MVDRGQSIQSRIFQYWQERKRFFIRVYIIAAIFIAISLAVWILFTFPFITFRELMKDYYFVAIPFLVLAMILIMAFVMSSRLRFMFPANWILSIVILLCITCGLIWTILESNWTTMGVCAVIVFFIVVLFLVIGAVIPADLTLHVMILFVFSIVFFIGSIFILMWGILADVDFSILIYMGLIALMVFMFIIYHAQTIHGGRFAEMRLNDYLLAALMIYHDYVILYLIMIFIYTAYVQTSVIHIHARKSSIHDCSYCERNVTAVFIN